ncbi:hypothetical protein PR048_033209 [Dryococelus australis]|uniref:Transposable element P transposase-like RNase H domain-containing protein n=1 Tax=Dryococelus australis TaxID=614101 RepID=A0ABQ9FZL4_9NEOP|nr:hypothetical protein PR048_033209 [Dryococelus australis]
MEEGRRNLLKPEAFPNQNLPDRKETVDCARSERGYNAGALKGNQNNFDQVIMKQYRRKRKKVGIPLPGLSTIRKWTRNVKCAPGVLEEVSTALHAKSQMTTLSERLTVLSLDEMQIDGRYCYDQTADQIPRPCKNVQVIMARGLASKWKRPIFYDFDTEVTRDLLFHVIKKLEQRGFIVAIVCDMGGSNQGLRKGLRGKKKVHLVFSLTRNILQVMGNETANLRILQHKCLVPFQEGILVTINSLRELRGFFNVRYSLECILTSRLNQDVVGSFSFPPRIRSVGHGNQNPYSCGLQVQATFIVPRMRNPSASWCVC